MIYSDTIDKEFERNSRFIAKTEDRERIRAFANDMKVEDGLS